MVQTLPSGLRVRIRPIGPGDKPALRAFLDALGEESVRRRFLVARHGFTTAELEYLTEVDGVDHIALIAEPPDDPGRILGVARCVRLPGEPGTAELAFVVADDVQGRGLGRRLTELLADRARAAGIRRFSATMLGDNRAARGLLRTISDRVASDTVGGGTRELLIDLAT